MNKLTVIEARKLTKKFKDFIAVNAIDFSIRESECFGFLGPNGAGKTTTMKMIYCISPITSGELSVMGLNPSKDPSKIKSIVGVVPQDDNLDPELTVEENLIVYSRFFGLSRKVYKQRIHELLELMSLNKKIDAKIRELSGGMKRRLVIIRALLHNPKILVLDEPTTGLDPQVRHLIWEKLRQLKESGITLLLTTHYMDEASQLCDRLIIMDHGSILLNGKPKDLIRKHVPKYVAEFSLNNSRMKIKEINFGDDIKMEIHGNRCYIYSDTDELLDKISDKLHIQEKIIRNSTLEDLFLKLTGRVLNE